MKLGVDWPSDLEKKMFESNGHIHVYIIAQGRGQTTPWGIFFHKHNYSVNLLQVFPIK